MFISLIKARKGVTRERGQGLVEYSLILVLVVVVAVFILSAVGQTVQNALYGDVACSMAEASGDPLPDC